MLNKEGERVENEQDIKQVYSDFYRNLLQTPEPETPAEEEIERSVDGRFKSIKMIADMQRPVEITEEHIRNTIKTLKRKKASDIQKWTNEMILEGGEEMLKSVTLMFNAITQQQKIPAQWTNMKIKSIHKKGSKMRMENKRGLFLTNVLSKLYERVLDHVTKGTVQMNEHQCGGQKGRSTSDNIIMMRAVIDNNRRLNKKTYCYFADAYKCFDRLWLKDCPLEMWRAGMREREVMMIYELNSKAEIIIETPVGMTDSIVVEEIVKQGTVFGPKLCSISTEKVNNMNNAIATYITPELGIGAPVYVDDILGIGNQATVQNVIRNTRQMEVEKKFKFSRKKSKYMVVNSGKEKLQIIQESIKEGMIERTTEYKYLGWWFNEENSAKTQLIELESKLDYMIREIKISGSKQRVGGQDARVQRMLYDKVIVPTLTYNMETNTNMTSKEYKMLEKLQGRALRKIYNVPSTTPYWGLLIELGVKPLEYEIHYKRLMLYHNIMNSSDERISKQIVMQQRKHQHTHGFYQEIRKSATALKVKLEDVIERRVKKSEWKRALKEQMKKVLNEKANAISGEMTKLRHIQGSDLEEKEYVKKCNMEDLTDILKLRLNMIKLDCNYGKKGNCKLCGGERETLEHMLECKEVKKQLGYEVTGCITSVYKEELTELCTYMKGAVHIIEARKTKFNVE